MCVCVCVCVCVCAKVLIHTFNSSTEFSRDHFVVVFKLAPGLLVNVFFSKFIFFFFFCIIICFRYVVFADCMHIGLSSNYLLMFVLPVHFFIMKNCHGVSGVDNNYLYRLLLHLCSAVSLISSTHCG